MRTACAIQRQKKYIHTAESCYFPYDPGYIYDEGRRLATDAASNSILCPPIERRHQPPILMQRRGTKRFRFVPLRHGRDDADSFAPVRRPVQSACFGVFYTRAKNPSPRRVRYGKIRYHIARDSPCAGAGRRRYGPATYFRAEATAHGATSKEKEVCS
jgi:hypothetical protein